MFTCNECAKDVPNIILISDTVMICVKCIPTYTKTHRTKKDMLLNIWKGDHSFCHVCELDLIEPAQLWMNASALNSDIAVCNDHRCKAALMAQGNGYSNVYNGCSRCACSIKKYEMYFINKERLCRTCAGLPTMNEHESHPNVCGVCGLLGKPRVDLSCYNETEWRCATCAAFTR